MSIVVQIPGIFVDDVLFEDSPADLLVINRNPQPGATDVDASPVFYFDIVDTSGGAPVLADSRVYLDNGAGEVLVHDGAAFQPGFAGALSATSTPDAASLRFVIEPTLVPFDSLSDVTLRVTSTNGTASIDTSWTFTIEDLTAPVLSDVEPIGKDVLRVTFDEDVNATALIAANYEIQRNNVYPAAAYLPTVVSVERFAGNIVDLTLDDSMTHGAPYTLKATGVEDDDGNAIFAPYNSRSFVGFTPPIPEGRSFNYFRMLAQKWRDEDSTRELEAFSSVVQDTIDQLLCLIDEWPAKVLDVDTAEEQFLDAMLIDLANPFGFDLSVNDKRRLVRLLVDIYRQKGTDVGIINVVRFFTGIEITIQAFGAEGWDLGVDELGESTVLGPSSSYNRYAFEILSPVALSAEQESRITELAEFMKPAHTHLVQVISPATPSVIDHLELGLSELGTEWILHS